MKKNGKFNLIQFFRQSAVKIKMSSTEFNIGLSNNRSSSRVLQPPVSNHYFNEISFSKFEIIFFCTKKSIFLLNWVRVMI